jgi:hypothetical protein
MEKGGLPRRFSSFSSDNSYNRYTNLPTQKSALSYFHAVLGFDTVLDATRRRRNKNRSSFKRRGGATPFKKEEK